MDHTLLQKYRIYFSKNYFWLWILAEVELPVLLAAKLCPLHTAQCTLVQSPLVPLQKIFFIWWTPDNYLVATNIFG